MIDWTSLLPMIPPWIANLLAGLSLAVSGAA